MKPEYSLQGGKSLMEVYEDRVCLTPKGLLGKMIADGNTKAIVIPFSSIGCIRLKTPGLSAGYMQFVIQGENVSKSGPFAAVQDKNAFTFSTKTKAVQEIKEFIEARISSIPEHVMLEKQASLDRQKKEEQQARISRVAEQQAASTISPVYSVNGVSSLLGRLWTTQAFKGAEA